MLCLDLSIQQTATLLTHPLPTPVDILQEAIPQDPDTPQPPAILWDLRSMINFLHHQRMIGELFLRDVYSFFHKWNPKTKIWAVAKDKSAHARAYSRTLGWLSLVSTISWRRMISVCHIKICYGQLTRPTSFHYFFMFVKIQFFCSIS